MYCLMKAILIYEQGFCKFDNNFEFINRCSRSAKYLPKHDVL